MTAREQLVSGTLPRPEHSLVYDFATPPGWQPSGQRIARAGGTGRQENRVLRMAIPDQWKPGDSTCQNDVDGCGTGWQNRT